MDNNQKIIRNGEILNFADATVHVSNKAIWFNYGVYESIKVLQGKIFYPELHAKRLLNSASLLGINNSYIETDITGWIEKKCSIDKIKDGLIRIIMFGDAEKNTSSDVYIFHLGLTFYKDAIYSQGAKLVTYRGERFIPKAKSINTLLNYVAYSMAVQQGAMDSLLINSKGFVTEGTRTNFFIVKDGVIKSAKINDILDGVTRIKLLEVIDSGYKYLEDNITLEEVYTADECFITSTSMNIMPVTQVDNKLILGGSVGAITKNLIIDFRAMQKDYLANHKPIEKHV